MVYLDLYSDKVWRFSIFSFCTPPGDIYGQPLLRAILCNSEAMWKIKILKIKKFVVGCLKIHFVRVATLLLSRKHQLFVGCKKRNINSETVVKSAKCVALFLKFIKTLRPKTWSKYNTIILVYIYVY